MNRQQQQVERQLLQNEKDVLKAFEKNYAATLADIKGKIKVLMADEMTQSKIYQIAYQKNLERQIKAILEVLKTDNVQTINEYLALCYEDGFIGNLYGLSGDNLKMTLPIDQRQVIASITKETAGIKVSSRIYEDINQLQKEVKDVLSRGLAQNATYSEMAVQLSLQSEASLKRAYRIIQTEGHRVQNEAKFDSMHAAAGAGADIVKQWDSTMDKKTRKSHVKLDGQIREMEEPFEVNGKKAQHPGGFGVGKEDIRCRCVMLTRPRWVVEDGADLKRNQIPRNTVKMDGQTYKQWKERYREAIAMPMHLNATNPLDPYGIYAQKIKHKEGFYDVVVHGDEKNFGVQREADPSSGHLMLSPKDLCDMIKKSGDYQDEPIRLIACKAAADNAVVAQKLANALGVLVEAPDDLIFIHPNGNLTIGPDEFTDSGKWVKLYPEVTK